MRARAWCDLLLASISPFWDPKRTFGLRPEPPRRVRFRLQGAPFEGTPEFRVSHYREDGLRPDIAGLFSDYKMFWGER